MGNKNVIKKSFLSRLLLGLLKILCIYFLYCVLVLGYLKFFNPIFTTVQVQRIIESVLKGEQNNFRQNRLPLAAISPNLQHAVIAAEDAQFYAHDGVDWKELEEAAKKPLNQMRGASTITQQLIKNLFFTTHRNPLRKAFEFLLTPFAEFILGKERILALYLNEVEWGKGNVFGADAAATLHYGISARSMSKNVAARLAAILPAPQTRVPQEMNRYSRIIRLRMQQMGY